jgi:hypothetical protein
MDVLDFNLHQLILHDLAATVDNPKDDESTSRAMDLLTSRVQTRDISTTAGSTQERVFMVGEEVLCCTPCILMFMSPSLNLV